MTDLKAIQERVGKASVTDEERALLRPEELKALEIHQRIPGSVHACPPWVLKALAEARRRIAELEGRK